MPERYTEAAIYIMLGILTRSEGHFAQSRSYFEQSRFISETLSDPYAIRFAIMGLAEIATRLGELEEAAANYCNCIALNSAACDTEGVAAAKRRLAYVYWLQGRNLAEADQLANESLALCREIEDKYGLSHTPLVLGNLACEVGDTTSLSRTIQKASAFA